MKICGAEITAQDIFGYQTFKVVKVKDLRLGILYRCFQIAILLYIIIEIFRRFLYLKTELPVPGAVRITLQAPSSIDTPSYCSGSLPCTFWGANEIQFPSDGAGVAFFTTRASATNFPRPAAGCNFLNVSSPTDTCFFNQTNGTTILPKSFIGGIESYTIMVEHSVRGAATSVSLRNGLMTGELYSFKGNLIKTITNASRMAINPNADGDIFSIQEILSAAGADLDAPSTAPGANKAAGETYRSSGIVIPIVIEYQNKGSEITYKYLPEIIDGNEYKAVENIYNPTDGSFTIIDRHGIRLVFTQHGKIGQFDFITLLTNLVASFALFKLAEFVVEIIMLKFLPQKEEYEDAKFETTEYKDGEVAIKTARDAHDS